MSIHRAADRRYHDILDGEAAFETLAEGFGFSEGTAWHPVERHVTVTDIFNSRIHRWSADTGEMTVLREPSNMANGTTYDRQGRLLMCEHATSRITRLEADGSITIVADRWQDSELNSPNDVVVDDRDAIWFTDPIYGRGGPGGVEREPALPFRGVFRLDPDGGMHLIADDYTGPNGLCFSPDKRRLYVNDSERAHIRVYEVDGEGKATGGEVFAETLDPDGDLGDGVPDGMKVDAEGNVWCAGPGGIHIFDPRGDLIGVLRTPNVCGNFCFGGDDMCELFVCSVSVFLRIPLRRPGHPIFNPG